MVYTLEFNDAARPHRVMRLWAVNLRIFQDMVAVLFMDNCSLPMDLSTIQISNCTSARHFSFVANIHPNGFLLRRAITAHLRYVFLWHGLYLGNDGRI